MYMLQNALWICHSGSMPDILCRHMTSYGSCMTDRLATISTTLKLSHQEAHAWEHYLQESRPGAGGRIATEAGLISI